MEEKEKAVVKVLPNCPECGSNNCVGKSEELHVMARLFIAKPLDEYFCSKCMKGFS